MQKKVVNLETGTESLVDLTSEEIKEREELAKRVEQEKKDAFDALTYDKKREDYYPSIQEQLDMQYWDAVNGTKKWQEAVAKVKTDNPKPE